MINEVFGPGIYTHYKEGVEYYAYEEVPDEGGGSPRILYLNLNKPEKKWSRPKDDFFAKVDSDGEENNTGQSIRFKFKTGFIPLIKEQSAANTYGPYFIRNGILNVGDNVSIVSSGVSMRGRVSNIGLWSLGISKTSVGLSTDTINVYWSSIDKLNKII